jgi:hypothetical protein
MHRGHAERIGNRAGMLTTSAAEADQRVLGDVIAALDRYGFDRVGHVLHGDLQESVGYLFGLFAIANLIGHCCKAFAYGIGIKRLILIGAENRREESGL